MKDVYMSAVALPEVDEQIEALLEQNKDLIIHNDDVNTFEYVIETLMDVCGHDSLQAEQCTYLIHYTGKCGVKTGPKNELRPLHTELLNRGLTAEIN